MQLKITLKPHIGAANTQIGELPVRIDQWIVVASGEEFTKATNRQLLELAYVGSKPKDPINWLPSANVFGEQVLKSLAIEVTKELAKVPNANSEDIALAEAGLARGAEPPMPLELAEAPIPEATLQDDTAGSEQNL